MKDSEFDLNRMKDTLQFIGEGVIYQEADGSSTFFNLMARRIFGISEEDVHCRAIKHPQWNMINEDGSPCPGPEHPSMITLRSGQPLNGQIRGIAKPGLPVTWISINTRPIYRPGLKSPGAVVISFSDITDRKKAKEELRESRARYQAIFETNLTPQLLIDPTDGAIVNANESACRLYGYSLPEIRAKKIFDINVLAPDELKNEMRRAMEKECLFFRFRHRLKSGELHDVEVYSGPVQVEGRTLLHSFIFDVTERKKTEEALRRSELRFRLNFERAPVGMALIDQDRRFIDVNAKLCEMIGYEPDELLGRLSDGFIHPDELEGVRNRWRSLVSGEMQMHQAERRYLHKDGHNVWVLVSNTLIRDNPDEPFYVLSHIVDDSIRKKTEATAAELSTIVSSSVDSIVGMNLNGEITSWNKAAEVLYGHSAKEAIGRHISMLIPEGHPDLTAKPWVRVTNGKKIGDYETVRLTKDGRLIDISLTVSPLLDDGGNLIGVAGISRNITERKQVERSLKASEERLRKAQAVAHVGSWELDLKTKKMWASKEAYRIYGLEMRPDQEMPLPKAQSVVAPSYRPGMDKALAELISRGGTYDQAFEIRRDDDGDIRFIHSKAELEYDHQGRPQKVVGTMQDVTDSKRKEMELRSSEERNRQILRTAIEGFLRLDPTGRLLEVNRAYCQMTGYTEQELLSMHVADLEAVEAPLDTADRIKRLEEKGRDRFETRHRRKDGSMFDVEVSVQYRRHAGGEEIVVFLRDITQRNLAERMLRESETLFREIYNNMSNGVAIYEAVDDGRDFVIKGLNHAGLTAADVVLEEIVGRRVGDVFPGVKALGLFDVFKRVWKTGLPEHHPSSLYQDANLAMWVENYVCKLPSGELVAIYEDITARKQAEMESQKLENQLRQAQKMEAIGTLAGGIAHDFNNILGAVLGYAEIAYDDAVAGQVDPADIAQIMNSVQRAKSLVKQILTFSRKNEPSLQPLSVNRACMGAQSILERTIPKMIAVESELAPGLPYVSADPTQIEQVLLNLCSNAADAMLDGGRLTLGTRLVNSDGICRKIRPEVPLGDYILLTVSDTGCGMDRETQDHIFEPFFTTKEIGKGTGLGLSTVYGIIKNHRGFIFCESKPDQGTTFSIYLPVIKQDSLDSQTESPAEDGNAFAGTETILLVDDEKALRKIAERMLRGAGYRVLEASSGEAALEVLAGQALLPDMVITDLGMPGMGGQKAIREVLARFPGIKIIVVSGYSAQAQANTALEAGAAAYVAKPFKKVELLATVRNVLDK